MEPITPIRIAIVEDHELMRTMLASLANQWPHGQVVLQAVHGKDYMEKLPDAGPIDLVIVDLLMPVMDGFDTMAWIKEEQPATRMLAITYDPQDAVVHRALLAGAHGILGKNCSPKELYTAMEALRTAGRFANDLLMRQVSFVPDANSPWMLKKKMLRTLTPRELEFGLAYVSDESPSRKEISGRMRISVHTAESHRRSIVEKTGATTRLSLFKCFLRFGLVQL